MKIELNYPRALFAIMLPVMALILLGFFHQPLTHPAANPSIRLFRYAELVVVIVWSVAWLIRVSVPLFRSLASYPVTFEAERLRLNRREIDYAQLVSVELSARPSRRASLRTSRGDQLSLSLAFSGASNEEWLKLFSSHGVLASTR